jgi:hypothetical protein
MEAGSMPAEPPVVSLVPTSFSVSLPSEFDDFIQMEFSDLAGIVLQGKRFRSISSSLIRLS